MEGLGVMQSIAEAFRAGGMWMYAIFALALMTHIGGLVGGVLSLLAKPGHRLVLIILGVIGIAATLTTLAIGGAGYVIGIADVQQALEHVSPENLERMRERGTEYARMPLYFGIGASILPGLLSLFVLFRAYSLRSTEDAKSL